MNLEDLKHIAAMGGAQPKLPITIDEQGDFILTKDYKYVLTRLDDGLVKRADRVCYLEWNEDGTWKETHSDIAIGRSLLLDPRMSYAWLTTTITEIVEQRADYIKFRTQNSIYELKIS
jgi:hypothetical protein